MNLPYYYLTPVQDAREKIPRALIGYGRWLVPAQPCFIRVAGKRWGPLSRSSAPHSSLLYGEVCATPVSWGRPLSKFSILFVKFDAFFEKKVIALFFFILSRNIEKYVKERRVFGELRPERLLLESRCCAVAATHPATRETSYHLRSV